MIDVAWKIVPSCYNLKSFETLKGSRRSGSITSLQKVWTAIDFFLIYLDFDTEVTDSDSDTDSQQSNFFEISILLEVSGRWYFAKT